MGEVILVDKNDNIVGYKNRNNLSNSDIVRVSVLNVINSQGDTLLSRRSFLKKNNPGEWGPAVSGMNEKGESPEQSIIKETKQEIGINLYNLERITKINLKTNLNIVSIFFESIVDLPESDFVPDQKEVIEVKWFTKKDLQKILDKSSNIFLTSPLKIA
ncbi:NUDIX domain-containing protein [Candidatus Gracilibacteria bacterium]|nr:NUDIX domain-containing protein [Candidatus Gracilibacteria bacterium]